MVKAMKYLIFVAVLFSTVSLLFTRSIGIEEVSAVEAQSDQKESERLLEIGRQLFVKSCSSCHRERGDKPLATGLPLSERKLTTEIVAKNVASRLKAATDEEKRAVALYICSFLKKSCS